MMATLASARALMERVYKCIKPSSKADYREFSTACIQLARLIDIAVAKNQKLSILHDLTQLLRKVCEQKDNEMFQPAIMVLLLSVKNAIHSGWFSAAEGQELLNMSKDLLGFFTGMGGWNAVDKAEAAQFITAIIPRFYPSLSLKTVLYAWEAKSGYEAMVCDFYLWNKPSSPEELRLFVIRRDCQDTSACLVTPSHVNFLVNGKGVEKRSSASMDTGPQMPTNVTGMLKIGTNLMQIIGDFSGAYMIAICTTNTAVEFSSPLSLQISSLAGTKALADDELIEGPSRVSLRCPISHKRITSPVKGSVCKHHQCFDYYTFMEINSRRPAWRCPYCNRHVSFPDLRLDLQMLKILKEAQDDAIDVMVSEDGTWENLTCEEGIIGNLEVVQMYRKKNHNSQQCSGESSPEEGEICSEKFSSNMIDLSDDNEQERASNTANSYGFDSNAVVRSGYGEMEDRKPDLQEINLSTSDPLTVVQIDSLACVTTAGGATSSMGLETSGLFSSFGSLPSNVLNSSTPPIRVSHSEASQEESVLDVLGSSSLATLANNDFSTCHAIQALPGEGAGFGAATLADGVPDRQSNRETNRSPIAIQALPAQTSIPNPNFRSRPRTSSQPNSPAHQSSSPNPITTSSSQFMASQRSPQIQLPSMIGVHEGQVLWNAGYQQASHDPLSTLEMPHTNPMQQGVDMRERQRLIQHLQRTSVTQPSAQPDQRAFMEHPHNSAARTIGQMRTERQGLLQQQVSYQQPARQDSITMLDNQFLQHMRYSAQALPMQQLQHSNLVNNTQREENVSPVVTGIADGIPVYNQSPTGSVAMVGTLRRQSSQGARTVAPQFLQPSNNPLIIPNAGTPREQRWVNSSEPLPGPASDVAAGFLAEPNQRPVIRMRGSISNAGRTPAVNVSLIQTPGSPGNYAWLYGVSPQPAFMTIPSAVTNSSQSSRFSPAVSTSLSNELLRQWSPSTISTGLGTIMQTSQTPSTLGTDFNNWFDLQFENPIQGTGSLFDSGDFGPL